MIFNKKQYVRIIINLVKTSTVNRKIQTLAQNIKLNFLLIELSCKPNSFSRKIRS